MPDQDYDAEKTPWRKLPKEDRKERTTTFQGAVRELVQYGKVAKDAGIHDETPEYSRLNERVNDLWGSVPWYVRLSTYHLHAGQYEDEA